MPASVKLAKAVPLASSTMSCCPAIYDVAVSCRLLTVTEASATGAPRSICKNSFLVLPDEMYKLTPVDAMSPSTA